MGDFNSQIGKKNIGETVIGPYGYKSRNERGEKLISFCHENKLFIMNSFFKKRVGKRWTWLAPNGKDRTEIDFILAREKKLIKNIDIGSSFLFQSDHRLIKVELNIKHIGVRPKRIWNSQLQQNQLEHNPDFKKNLEKNRSRLNLNINSLSIQRVLRKFCNTALFI